MSNPECVSVTFAPQIVSNRAEIPGQVDASAGEWHIFRNNKRLRTRMVEAKNEAGSQMKRAAIHAAGHAAGRV